MNLKRWLGAVVILGACGCNSMNNTEAGALGGGAIGAGAGALLGAATGHAGAGAAIGAGVGAVTGGLIGHSEDRAEDRQKKAAADWAAQNPPLGLPDVVQMTQQHISEDIIIRQMEVTRSYYNLRPEDITYLKSQGVSDRIIYVMQSRRGGGGAVVVQGQPYYLVDPPPPPPVRVGVGFGYGYGRRW
jgi:outer membrane protein with glycine zipper